MAEREKLIEVKDLQVSFGKGRKKFIAVDHVNFDIYKGETFSLVGESGSGKTTIGRAITRINPTSGGEIYFKGQKINGKISKELDREVIKKCQMIFQDPMASLNERAKVDYIISEGLINFHLYKNEAEREAKVQKALREVNLLPEFASRFPHEFSGGQRQRIGIARALIMEPAYPAYVDANIMAGREILHLPSGPENGFLPLPREDLEADLIYLCSPNNPTGAAYSREQLACWVRWANARGAVILFDAAYEAFIEEDLPHSIFEIPGARTCAIEICSLSKTAGFTGTRLGYTVIPKELEREGLSLNAMWVRNRTTKTNGVSYILQRGGAAVFTEEGQRQIHENIRVYKENARVLMQALDKAGARYWGGKNAPYIWMACPDGMESWTFFDLLLNEIQVVGTPGAGFGACGEGFFRFSTFGDPADTAEAATRLLKLLTT